MLITLGEQLRPRTPEEAGEILARLASLHRFTLYEYFITDKLGHAQDMTSARMVLRNLARFVRALLFRLDLSKTTVILTSDHGNVEDLSTRNHTLNPVPTLLWGEHGESCASRIRTLADITPTIVDLLVKKVKTH
jgi:bisphosphoglycerate-independent phosphoglycerate mutase (AlkP superfamily)